MYSLEFVLIYLYFKMHLLVFRPLITSLPESLSLATVQISVRGCLKSTISEKQAQSDAVIIIFLCNLSKPFDYFVVRLFVCQLLKILSLGLLNTALKESVSRSTVDVAWTPLFLAQKSCSVTDCGHITFFPPLSLKGRKS